MDFTEKRGWGGSEKDHTTYSHLCLNPYLLVDTKKYGLLQSMGFGRAHPRAIFLGHITLYYVLNDYILSKYNNYEAK